ncbi:MAG: hypothetical protein FWF26_05415 [Treponema sp.]|nr:hypothetical protein [Treponema sp.]
MADYALPETKISKETLEQCQTDVPWAFCHRCNATEIECLKYLLEIAEDNQIENRLNNGDEEAKNARN